MFDFVRKHNRLFQFVLLILILPMFVVGGLEGYTSLMNGKRSTVATVDGLPITQTEWDNAHRNQVDRMRAQMPPGVDIKMFDTPELRRRTLDQLVQQRVLEVASQKQHVFVSSDAVNRVFQNDPQFAALRTPEGNPNDVMLARAGFSRASLLDQMRRDMVANQVKAGVVGGTIASKANATVAFDALLQQREVQVQRFDAMEFAARIEPSDAEIEAFYKDAANAAQFQLPESAQIEYVVLDLDALAKDAKVPEDKLRDYYDKNAARFAVAEERRASHILIAADKSAPAAERAKAKARAEELLAQVRKNPASFAEVAKKNSQDPGSAENGGALDFFGRDAMAKPFEDAAYALKQGEISNVVETDYGYHVIQLTGVRGGDKKSFESVRAEIERELGREQAQSGFAQAAENFSNTVYEQADSLKPAADKFKLTVQTATVQRKPAPGAVGVLASTKLLDAVFGNDALRNKRNTEAVETAPAQLVSARVVQHNPVRLQPLAEVKPKVRDLLIKRLATAQAVKAGQERLAALQKDPAADAAALGAAVTVSRAKPGQLSRKVLDGVMSADASKLPVHVGIDAGDGAYVVVRINKLLPRDPAVIDDQRMAQAYAQGWGRLEEHAFTEALKKRLKVEIKAAAAASAPTP